MRASDFVVPICFVVGFVAFLVFIYMSVATTATMIKDKCIQTSIVHATINYTDAKPIQGYLTGYVCKDGTMLFMPPRG